MIETKKINNNTILILPKFNFEITNYENVTELKNIIFNYINTENIVNIILNLEHCNFIDSFGIGNLLRIYEQIKKYNGKLMACNISKNIEKLFKITNLCSFITPIDNCNKFN